MPNKEFKQQEDGRRKAPGIVPMNSPYYVFNAENNDGFVIVSGDDRTKAILGYADKGELDVENAPDNVKWWLDEYTRQMDALRKAPSTTATDIPVINKPAITPLLSTQWNQNVNIMCPPDCPTGCVATAMAQIMYYHRWPQEACPALPKYNEMEDLPATIFKWDLMLDNYNDFWNRYESPNENDWAVAELMRYCGQSVEMGYHPNGSSSDSYHASNALKDYFDYSPTTRIVGCDEYTRKQWESLIYNEIDHNKPVLYSGHDTKVYGTGLGHAFVCDGFDGDGRFHINWGWGGMCDGFFVLSILNPSYPDGSMSNGGYSFFQDAIIGLEPNRGQKRDAELWINDIQVATEAYQNSSETRGFAPIGILANIENQGETSFSGFIGLAIYKDELPVGYGEERAIELEPKQHFVVQSEIASLGALSDGNYTIRMVYKADTNDTWGDVWGLPMLRVKVSDTHLIVTPYESTPRLQVNDVHIEGDLAKGTDFTAIINITNIGGNSHHWVDVQFGDFTDLINVVIDPGESATFRVKLRVNEEGEQSLSVKLGDDVIWNESYMIEPLVILSDEQYIKALNTIDFETAYAITTTWNDQKYYLTTEGYLTAKKREAGIFVFHRTEDSNLYRSPGWKLDACFSNPQLSEGATGVLYPQGHIRTDKGYNRISWEGQVWYLGDDGLYAVRSTNAESNLWGAATYWTVMDTDGNNQPEADYSWIPAFLWQVEQPPYKVGDVNGDGLVNVQDATIVVNYILGMENNDEYDYRLADMNEDGEIDVFDVTKMIAVILSGENFAKLRKVMGVQGPTIVEPLTMKNGTDEIALTVDNVNRFTSFQMDVEVPNGIALTGARLTNNESGHIVRYMKIGENLYRVMALSMSNTPLKASANELLDLDLTDGSDVQIGNIMFVTPQGEAVLFEALSENIVTGIMSVCTSGSEEIYDLSGCKLNVRREQLPKGIYIINQKKVVIK